MPFKITDQEKTLEYSNGKLSVEESIKCDHLKINEAVLEKINTSTWTQLGSNLTTGGKEDYAGRSVSLSSNGTTVALGAVFADPGDVTNAGMVQVYSLETTVQLAVKFNDDHRFLATWIDKKMI